MSDLIEAAKNTSDTNIAIVCPGETEIDAINKGIAKGVINKAFLIGDLSQISKERFLLPDKYEYISINNSIDNYYQIACAKGIEIIKNGECEMLMKGQINTAHFIKSLLDKKDGISQGKLLSLISLFELPDIDRLIFLTDPGINPSLVTNNDLNSSKDIINNAIDVARCLGIDRPKIALLEANELPSKKIPTSIYEKQLAEMNWENADVFGPLSYDLALYQDAVKKKKVQANKVMGNADILVVPHISGGNFLYKAWSITMKAKVANIVLGAKVPLVITSRNDSDTTKYHTICASAVYSKYLKNTYK